MTDDKFADLPEQRARGLRKMEQVYGFDMTDGEGDFFAYTADHLFADIWNRPGLDRRTLSQVADLTPARWSAARS